MTENPWLTASAAEIKLILDRKFEDRDTFLKPASASNHWITGLGHKPVAFISLHRPVHSTHERTHRFKFMIQYRARLNKGGKEQGGPKMYMTLRSRRNQENGTLFRCCYRKKRYIHARVWAGACVRVHACNTSFSEFNRLLKSCGSSFLIVVQGSDERCYLFFSLMSSGNERALVATGIKLGWAPKPM